MGSEAGQLPANRPGRQEFLRVTASFSTQAPWPSCPRCRAVLQRGFKMPIYISALSGEACRNSAKLLAMRCTSAVSDIIRITLTRNVVQRDCSLSP